MLCRRNKHFKRDLSYTLDSYMVPLTGDPLTRFFQTRFFRKAGIYKTQRQKRHLEPHRFTNFLGPPVEPCAVDISVGRVGQRTICIHKPMHASQLGRSMCNLAFVWPCVLCTQCHDMVVCVCIFWPLSF